jgi:single-strand DNA-binding protein
MNKVLLVGRLVRDPELQETTSGIKYTRFTIAVDNPFSKDQSADYVPCIA